MPSGRLRLRIVVQDISSERIGSVDCDLDLPEFAADLSISDVVVTSSGSGDVADLPGEYLNRLRAELPGSPTTRRQFQ